MNKVFPAVSKLIVMICLVLSFSACKDKSVIDTSEEISGRTWSYTKKMSFPVKIENAQRSYNLYFNLRHTADYRYSNIFVLVHQKSPQGVTTTERKEFTLAYPDGEWLGSGSGNIYSYQLPFRERYKFPGPGTYVFTFEQNMRDNPLKEITDVGIRVEPVE